MTSVSAGGWDPANPAVRDVVPAVMRGNNLVVVVPPAPVYAAPALAALLDRRADTGSSLLAMVPPVGIEEWSTVLAAIAGGVEPPPLLALGWRQAERHLAAGAGVVLTSPATTITLRQRSLLATDRIGAVLIGWPELWEDAEALTVALEDFPRDSQRVIVTSEPTSIAGLIERHAWRAMTVGYTVTAVPVEVLTVAVPWDRRVATLPRLAERLRSESVAVWTADQSRHPEIMTALSGSAIPVEVTTTVPSGASRIIAFDPPPSEVLIQLAEAGPVTLLMPPGTERWIERVGGTRKALVLSSGLDAMNEALTRRRSTIEQVIRDEPLDEGYLALGPLFETHDPAATAAALYKLWTRLPEPALARQAQVAAAAAPKSRVWIGAGKRDEIAVGDLVGFLINEARLERSSIGRIELRETFSLVEVPSPEAERIAQAISGKTLRKRRLVAKVDRKP